MTKDVPLHIIHLDQDDPKKCTARKLAKRELANLHFSTSRPPRRGFLLDPSADFHLRGKISTIRKSKITNIKNPVTQIFKLVPCIEVLMVLERLIKFG